MKPCKSLRVLLVLHSKVKSVDASKIGATLGVTHVLEGSVRKAGDQIRITAQLIDVSNGFHYWSEVYDGNLDNIFAIQDEVSIDIAVRVR